MFIMKKTAKEESAQKLINYNKPLTSDVIFVMFLFAFNIVLISETRSLN